MFVLATAELNNIRPLTNIHNAPWFYVLFMAASSHRLGAFRPGAVRLPLANQGSRHAGFRVCGGWSRPVRGLRALRRSVEARLKMLVTVLYVAGAVVVTVYMLAALLRPDKF
jgi:hypothetical protein